MNRTATLVATAAVLALTACSSSAHTNSIAAPTTTSATVGAPPSTGQSTPPSPMTTAASPTLTLPPGVSLSGNARYLPPGPFKITPLTCGTYTAAQQAQFGTGDKGGLVYRYTNVSNTLTDAPILSVDFLRGTNAIGSNVSGTLIQVGPGQSAEATVTATSGGGTDLTGYTCELMSYDLQTGSLGTFAP